MSIKDRFVFLSPHNYRLGVGRRLAGRTMAREHLSLIRGQREWRGGRRSGGERMGRGGWGGGVML